MVTAELALAIPVVVVLLAALVAVVLTVGAHLGCVDAAREGVRALARGEPPSVVDEVIARSGPKGAVASVSTSGESVIVTVRAAVSPLGGLAGSWTVQATATARVEPGHGDPGVASSGDFGSDNAGFDGDPP